MFRPAGYAFLIKKYQLNVIPNWHSSSISHRSAISSSIQDDQVESVYPPSYWPGDDTGSHLEFSMKYDGVNLGILSALFKSVPESDIVDYVKSKPTGKYARRIWFLFEFLTDHKLPLPDLTKGNYIELLELERYYTTNPPRRVQRQRIMENLLGGPSFCPVVRRTAELSAMESLNLRQRCEDLVTHYSSELLRRALSYLYNKETKSSFGIEHIKPSASRIERFIGLLQMAEHQDYLVKNLLIDVQNRIVDPRFRAADYRTDQNYVGQSISYQKQVLHYICPKPEDLPRLMEGLLLSHRMMSDSNVPAVIQAAVISYGFVFMHPFDDGNGRIHRFLIHNILSMRDMVPGGLMFPVSAAMLKNPRQYDLSLESFSKPLMQIVEYDLDDLGQLTVQGDTAPLYRFIDMTTQAKHLYEFMILTIENELVEELDFLAGYDKAKQSIQEIIDMPDRQIDLFIRLSLQNNGRLSERKRESQFSFLTDDELTGMEDAVRSGFIHS